MIIDKENFYSYNQLVECIEQVRDEYRQYVKLDSLTKTPQGRDIWMLTITSPDQLDTIKPGYIIFANVHASELAGTTQCLHTIKTLLENCRDTLLKDVVFYIIPRANPDGAECAMKLKRAIRSRTVVKKRMNGLIPNDLNNDGKVLSMRIKHLEGNMIEYPPDRRIMIEKCDEYQTEETYFVFDEGEIFEFTDISSIQSCIEQTDFNRNWPANWKMTPSSGKYPFSEPEVKALGEFIINHPNIFAGIDFHCGSKAIFRPASVEDDKIETDDLKTIKRVGEIAASMTGEVFLVDGYREDNSEPLTGFGGNSTDFAYFMVGISFFVFELGFGFSDLGMSTQEILKIFNKGQNYLMREYVPKMLQLQDDKGHSFFWEWKEYQHPQLGRVEIGGLENPQCNAYYMYPPYAWDLYEKNTLFILEHATYHPIIEIVSSEERKTGDHLTITCHIRNNGYFDTNIMRIDRKFGKSPIIAVVYNQDNVKISYCEIPEIKSGEQIKVDFKIPDYASINSYTVKAYHPRAGETVYCKSFLK